MDIGDPLPVPDYPKKEAFSQLPINPPKLRGALLIPTVSDTTLSVCRPQALQGFSFLVSLR